MLARPATRITFLDLLQAVDSDPSTNRCVFGRPKCSDANPCPLHPAWKKVRDAFLDWARSTTLADVTTGSKR